MSTILDLRAVSKEFATQRAVHEVSLQVPQGAFFALLGPSGCGKTTVLRMVAGFETPSSGEVWLDGTRIDALPPYRRNVNTVFQSYALFPHLTVRENVAFGLRGRDGEARRCDEALEMVRLSAKADRQPHQLSGGERQRVALARALVMQPAVLLLDEPLSALDPLLRKQVRGELKELQRRVGITFLFVTHDQEEALSLSDQIAVMNGGRVEQVGSPRDVYERPASKFVAEFMGAIHWAGGVGVRPEHVRVCGDGRRGVVTDVTYLGSVAHVQVRLDDGCIVTAQCAPGHEPATGAAVCVTWDAHHEVRL